MKEGKGREAILMEGKRWKEKKREGKEKRREKKRKRRGKREEE